MLFVPPARPVRFYIGLGAGVERHAPDGCELGEVADALSGLDWVCAR